MSEILEEKLDEHLEHEEEFIQNEKKAFDQNNFDTPSLKNEQIEASWEKDSQSENELSEEETPEKKVGFHSEAK